MLLLFLGKMIAPHIEKLSDEMKDVHFYKVNVDEAEDVAAFCGIEAMPTFRFYKGGKQVAEIIGADLDGVKNAIQKHK